jgi:hypothetical protein
MRCKAARKEIKFKGERDQNETKINITIGLTAAVYKSTYSNGSTTKHCSAGGGSRMFIKHVQDLISSSYLLRCPHHTMGKSGILIYNQLRNASLVTICFINVTAC